MLGLADKALRAGFNVDPVEPAQLRRHRASGSRPLPFRPHAGRRLRDQGARASRWPRPRRRGGLLARRKSRAEAGWRTLARGTADAGRGVRGLAGARARSVRPGTGAAIEFHLPVELRAQPEGRACAGRRATHPGAFSLDPLATIRTVREFDEAYTAPHFGFASAADYYHRAAGMRVVDRIRIPALVVSAADDPFVPAAIFQDPSLAANPNIRLVVTEHGGHCGFLGPATGADDGYWAERMIVEFAARRDVGDLRPRPAARPRAAANSGPLPSSSCLK